MSMEYKIKNIKSLTSLITKGTTPSNIGESFTDAGVMFFRSELIGKQKYIDKSEGLLFISEETHKKLKRSQIHKGDLLFSMAGAYLGKISLVSESDVPSNTNQAVAIIRFLPGICNIEYIYYYMIQKWFNTYTCSFNAQAAQPNINLEQIGKLKLNLPVRKIQDKIASILTTYDNLIETNNERIKALEQMAENLYKEWFVRFRFPGHETVEFDNGIPKTWDKKKLSDIVKFLNGFAFKSEEYDDEGEYIVITIKNVQNGKLDMSSIERICTIPYGMPDYCILSKGDILMSLTGNVGRVCFVSEDNCLLNQRVCKIVSQYPYYIFVFFKQEVIFQTLCNIAYGTAQLNLSPILAGKIKVFFPSVGLMKQYNDTVAPFYNEIQKLNEQNQSLVKQRDLLLPRLMSGKMEV